MANWLNGAGARISTPDWILLPLAGWILCSRHGTHFVHGTLVQNKDCRTEARSTYYY